MRSRRILLACLAAALTIGLLEIICLAAFKPLSGVPFRAAELRESRHERMAQLRQVLAVHHGPKTLYVFHPYAGYIGRPGEQPWGEQQVAFNQFGMLSTPGHRYPYRKAPGELVIAVVGGSVAEIFANQVEAELNASLRELDPSFDRRVVVINLATGGYKQPQQLFHLQYAMLAGFEFDAVLNIDGYNDLVLASQNVANGIHPLYPSGFHLGLMSKIALSGRLDAATVEQLSRYYKLHRRELRLLSVIDRAPLRYSPFMNLLGLLWTRRNETRVDEAKFTAASDAQESLAEEFRGPAWEQREENDYEAVAALWSRSSEMLHSVARAHGMLYLHVLQPNQYVEGSKPLSAHEIQVAYEPDNTWSEAAREGYRYLVSAGKRLKAGGVPFHDLTMVFADSPEDLYNDVCCHFNEKGNSILARRIAELLIQELEKGTGP